MLGSSNSIACCNMMLNTAVAEALRQFADALEGVEDFDGALHELIKQTITAHKRIIFNGNGYDDAWIREAAEVRGLLNMRTTPDAMQAILDQKNMEMLISHKVFSEAELRSRYEIQMENYCKTVSIEALTMVDMARKDILPAVESYTASVAASAAKKAVDADLACGYEKRLVKKLSALTDVIDARTDELSQAMGYCGLPPIYFKADSRKQSPEDRMTAGWWIPAGDCWAFTVWPSWVCTRRECSLLS